MMAHTLKAAGKTARIVILDTGINFVGRPVALQLRHEATDEPGDLICCGIEREMACIKDVHFGVGNVAAIGFRFRKIERWIVFPPEDEKPGMRFSHPGLPFRIVLNVRSIVVEEVALNIRLPRFAQEREFVRP